MRAEAHVVVPGEKDQFPVHLVFLAAHHAICGEPLLEGVAVDLDLDGVAVPGLRAGEGFGGRRRWCEGDEARVEQEPPSGQTR